MNISNETKNTLKIIILAGFVFFLMMSAFRCNKLDDNLNQLELNNDTATINYAPAEVMHPGNDPIFEGYDLNSDPQLYGVDFSDSRYGGYNSLTASWTRYMYVDKTDTIYNVTSARNRFSNYLKKYGFTGVYLYDTRAILTNSANFTNFSNFLNQLNDSGVVVRAVNKDAASDFLVGGKVSNYNNTQTLASRKINRSNLELEWWNNVTTWSNWISIVQQMNSSTVPDNDFYEGWYTNLGGVIDSVASKLQVQYSDRILEHVYVNGIPTYGYANAISTGASSGRLDLIAKGARQNNRKIDLYIIISAEKKSFGAANDFSGGVLQAANTQSNPFLYIENQAYTNIYGSMTAFQKQWINFKGFVWFDKRWCYSAVVPK